MYGLVLIIVAFLIRNLTFYAIGLGLFIDEFPPILVRGPGHRNEDWNGCEDYFSPWCFSGVLILIFVIYIFRNAISGLI